MFDLNHPSLQGLVLIEPPRPVDRRAAAMPKVLQISKHFPPVRGGIESVTRELTEGLHRRDVPISVLCSNNTPMTAEQTSLAGYSIVRAAQWTKVMSASVVPSMPWLLRRLKVDHDLIHVHMPDPMAALALWLTRPRAKIVVHWHSDVVRQRVALSVYEPLQRWLLQRADAVIATSAPIASASQALRPWVDKTTVIPIGISDAFDRTQSLAAARLRKRYRDRRIVFALGRMTYYKGFEVLIRAAKALPDDTVVLIGGDGALLSRCRKAVLEWGLEDKVHLLGHIDQEALPHFFDACDVFCLPSTARAEAYGVVMLEAMMMGKPVVATDIAGSGVPWVNAHGESGLNVPVGDAAALAQALTRLLADDALRRRLGAAARARYLREFTAEMMIDRTLDLYRRVMKQ